MNKFYVIEGNKRVSVLKYFGADSVPAMVIRKLPKRTDELENKIYYKFEGHAPEYISRDLRACAEIVSNLDAKMLQLNEAILEEKEKEEQKKKEE